MPQTRKGSLEHWGKGCSNAGSTSLITTKLEPDLIIRNSSMVPGDTIDARNILWVLSVDVSRKYGVQCTYRFVLSQF